jgi:hypothetical protein
MKNKFCISILLIFIMGIESCNQIADSVAPEVSTTLSKSFQIKIYQNSGTSNEGIIDIAASSEYNNFKNLVKGYKLTKITYQLKNDNVPTDMYFSGSVICKNEDGTKTFTAGNISRVKISQVAGPTNENELTQNQTDINNVLGWLESTGRFIIVSSYSVTDEQNAPYPITSTVAGSNFELIVRFYIVVKTST